MYQAGLIGISCGALWPNLHLGGRYGNGFSSQNSLLKMEADFLLALLQ